MTFQLPAQLFSAYLELYPTCQAARRLLMQQNITYLEDMSRQIAYLLPLLWASMLEMALPKVRPAVRLNPCR